MCSFIINYISLVIFILKDEKRVSIIVLWMPLFTFISAFSLPCYDNGIYFLVILIKQIPKRSNILWSFKRFCQLKIPRSYTKLRTHYCTILNLAGVIL